MLIDESIRVFAIEAWCNITPLKSHEFFVVANIQVPSNAWPSLVAREDDSHNNKVKQLNLINSESSVFLPTGFSQRFIEYLGLVEGEPFETVEIYRNDEKIIELDIEHRMTFDFTVTQKN